MTDTTPTKRRNWAALDADWYDDEVLDAIADTEPAALWLWPVLVGMSKKQSDAADNTSGTIRTSTKRLANIVRVPTDRITTALELLVEGELVEVEQGRLGTVMVTLARFSTWQYPNGHTADRKRQHRARVAQRGPGGAHVYFAASADGQQIKIGYSTQVGVRVNELRDLAGNPVQLVGAIPGTEADEKALHRKFSNLHVAGEWFQNTDAVREYLADTFAGKNGAIGTVAERGETRGHYTTQHNTTQHNTSTSSVSKTTGSVNADAPTTGPVLGEQESNAAIGGARRKLGALAMVADQLADAYPTWSANTMLQNVYHPAVVCLREYGDTVLGEALQSATTKPPDQPRTWLPKVCARIAERATGHLQAVEAKRETELETYNRLKREAGLA